MCHPVFKIMEISVFDRNLSFSLFRLGLFRLQISHSVINELLGLHFVVKVL